MKRADLHVHSHYSAHPSEWFLQRIGTRESYTEPEELYNDAKKCGMDFVTITDHNCICGAMGLKENHPEDVIVGCEFTTYFPENGCKIHVLVWGLDRKQFNEMCDIRTSIYDLRDYVKKHDLAHAVAHATFSVNRKLSADLVEKLILLFDHFEGVNGAREFRSNQLFMSLLGSLTPAKIDELKRKHDIEPISDRPWVKGITGGSDDHSGLFIGHTYTVVDEEISSPEQFLEMLKRKHSIAGGRHNDYRGFALSLYKIAWEFSRSRSSVLSDSIFSTLSGMAFSGGKLGFRKRLALRPILKQQNELAEAIEDLVNDLSGKQIGSMDERVDTIYKHATRFSDIFFSQFVTRITEAVTDADFAGVMRNISGMIPAVFISLPFFTTMSVLNNSREISDELKRRHLPPEPVRKKRVLWFTDTFTDLNGVSETLQKMSNIAYEEELNVRIVTVELDQIPGVREEMIMRIDKVGEYPINFFKGFDLKMPSLLNALQKISAYSPDELVISTPGPMGLVGLVAAKLLNMKVSGVYHTDFTNYFRSITEDENVALLVQDAMRLFYSQMETVYVPSEAYRRILIGRDYESDTLEVFRRGINPELFSPDKRDRSLFREKHDMPEGFTFLYTGRVSVEKNVVFMLEAFNALREIHPEVNLVLCGDGPQFEELSKKYQGYRICFTGRMSRKDLAHYYSSADMFLFPSVTDTFGMSVLEAQASGLPAIVSDRGGPQEIVESGSTGSVVSVDAAELWVNAMSQVVDLMNLYPEKYHELRHRTRARTVARFCWSNTVEDILGIHLDSKSEPESSFLFDTVGITPRAKEFADCSLTD